MGATITPDAVVPVSTGAVPFNDSYQETVSFDPGGPSTGAVELDYTGGLGEHAMPHLGADVEVRVPTPGPVTTEQWPGAPDGFGQTVLEPPTGVDEAEPPKPTRTRTRKAAAKKTTSSPSRAAAKKSSAKKAATTKAAADPANTGPEKTTKVVTPKPKAAPKKSTPATTKSRRR